MVGFSVNKNGVCISIFGGKCSKYSILKLKF